MPKIIDQDTANRVYIRDDVNQSLNYYMHESMALISGVPGLRMTKQDTVNQLLMNFLAEKGHYPPKDKDGGEGK